MVLKTIESNLLRKTLAVSEFFAKSLDINYQFDKCEPIARVNSEIIKLGENLEIEFLLACYDSKADLKVIYEGKELKIIDGKANLKLKTTMPGKQKHNVEINFMQPGYYKIQNINYNFEFEVIDNIN